MVDRLVYLSGSPVTERDLDRFGAGTISRHGCAVEYWDLSAMVRPVRHRAAYGDSGQSDLPSAGEVRVRILRSREETTRRIGRLPQGSVALSLMPFTVGTRWAYRALTDAGVPYGVKKFNVVPVALPRPADRLRSLLRDPVGALQGAANRVWKRLLASREGTSYPDFFLAGGRKSVESDQPVGPGTDVVWCHALDYDLYLEHRGRESGRTGHVVFLDEYLPYHPDFWGEGVEPLANPGDYYPRLDGVFDSVERSTGREVVVAAHPRSSYGNGKDHFAEREVSSGRTVELVRDSSAVIAHASTALTFAVLFEKPVMLLDMEIFGDPAFRRGVRLRGELLGVPCVTARELLDGGREPEFGFDPSGYRRYRHDYVKTPGSPERPCWEIVADYLCDTFA